MKLIQFAFFYYSRLDEEMLTPPTGIDEIKTITIT